MPLFIVWDIHTKYNCPEIWTIPTKIKKLPYSRMNGIWTPVQVTSMITNDPLSKSRPPPIRFKFHSALLYNQNLDICRFHLCTLIISVPIECSLHLLFQQRMQLEHMNIKNENSWVSFADLVMKQLVLQNQTAVYNCCVPRRAGERIEHKQLQNDT